MLGFKKRHDSKKFMGQVCSQSYQFISGETSLFSVESLQIYTGVAEQV